MKAQASNSLIQVSQTYNKYRDREEIWQSAEGLLTLTMVILLAIFAISPTVRAISDLLAEIRNREELSVKMKTKIEQLIAAQGEFAAVQRNLLVLDEYYPTQPQMTQAAANVIGLVKEKNLALKNITFDGLDFSQTSKASNPSATGKPGQEKGMIGLSLAMEGSFEKAKNFLSDFFLARRATKLKGYELGLIERKEGSALGLTIDGEILFSQP